MGIYAIQSETPFCFFFVLLLSTHLGNTGNGGTGGKVKALSRVGRVGQVR